MRKSKFRTLIGMTVAMVSIVASGCDGNKPDIVNPTSGSEAEIYNGYYASIGDKTGDELLRALNQLNSTKRQRTVSYDGMRTWAAKTDKDPNSNRIVSFYSRKLVGPTWDSGKTWNREHVWPNARGGNAVEGDAHMVRPCDTDDNGSRGQKFYSYGQYDPAELGFPNYRGICARIIFYCAIASTNLKVVDTEDDSTKRAMGKLSCLLEWNIQYPPTTSETADLELRVEQNRNNVIANEAQGNRNPFIDIPDYACRIWGRTNNNTKRICGIN